MNQENLSWEEDHDTSFTEEGVVEKVLSTKAIIRIQRSSSCSNCDSRHSCESLNKKEMLVEVANDLKAEVNDRVEISIPSRSLLKLSFFIYFLPVLFFVIGAGLGHEFSKSLQVDSSLAAIITGALAMVATYMLLKRFDRKVQAGMPYHPQMTRIISGEVTGKTEKCEA